MCILTFLVKTEFGKQLKKHRTVWIYFSIFFKCRDHEVLVIVPLDRLKQTVGDCGRLYEEQNIQF